MSSKLFLTATILALTSSLIAINHEFLHRPPVEEKLSGGHVHRREWEALPLDGAIGPESFAFDPLARGPYAGVSDGRIVKWEQHERRWINFSYASQKSDNKHSSFPVTTPSKKLLSTAIPLLLSTLAIVIFSSGQTPNSEPLSKAKARKLEEVPIVGAFGPESLAFDSLGEVPIRVYRMAG